MTVVTDKLRRLAAALKLRNGLNRFGQNEDAASELRALTPFPIEDKPAIVTKFALSFFTASPSPS
ncbi:MAG TPA: hypothetical protein VGS59_10015 [Candidatus Acidoferrales bacterium]|nr:hypothetical protein [Candidatus Acidoferrales bacterium]